MRGYKASYDGLCNNNFLYEVGKTYEMEEDPIICKRGFHFCENPDDVLKYYSIGFKSFVLFEIDAIGKIDKWYDKSCTNKIEIIRIIPKSEYKNVFNKENIVMDENDNLIYYKDTHAGFEARFDENHNCVWYKNYFGEFELKDKNWNLVERY
jgi:hypothetical protein